MFSFIFVALVLLQLGSLTHAFNAPPAPMWWLNTFLQKQTIGRYEPPGSGVINPAVGPCPDFANRCQLDLSKLPDSVKNIGVVLPSPFNSSVSLATAVPTGIISIWRVEVNDAEIESTTVGGVLETPGRQKISVKVHGFKANIKLSMAINDLSKPVSININQLEANVNKGGQVNGTDILFDVFVAAPNGKTLANSFPNNVTLGPCSIKLDLSLSVSGIQTNYPFQNLQNDVTNFVLGIAEPVLGDAVCGIIRQLFTTFDGKPGLITDFVNRAYTAVGNLTNNVPPTLAGEEAKMVAQLTPAQKDNAVTFADNTIVRGASVVVNNWLGAGNPGNPAVNEVVNLLTMPNNGTAVFTNLVDLGLSIPIHTPVAKVTVDVTTLKVSGLNSFSNIYGFQVIKNNYDVPLPRLNYTLDNKISLDDIRINLLANITLDKNSSSASPPGWIYPRPPLGIDQAKFQLNYSLGLKDLDVAVALSLVTDPKQLKLLKLGQLLGKQDLTKNAVQQLTAAGKCASPAMYAAAVPFFELQLADVITPVFQMSPVDVGIQNVVNDATAIILNVLESALTQDIDLISQFWVRPLVNNIVRDFFTAGGVQASCPNYVSHGIIRLNLRDSTIFQTAKDLIRDAIGGDPVRNTKASINELVTQLVLFLCEAFASSATCQQTTPGKWAFLPALSFYPGKSFPPSAGMPSAIEVTGINLNGVNSVYKLLLDNTPSNTQGFSLLLELGQSTNPLQIILKNHWRVNYPLSGPLSVKPDVDEAFDLKITIVGFKLNLTVLPDFDLDQLYLLRLEDLGSSACLLAPFISLATDLRLSSTSFQINMTNVEGAGGSNSNELRLALRQVKLDQDSGYQNVNTAFNFVLSSVGKFVNNQVKSVSNSLVNAANCADEVNKFDTFIVRLLFATLSANLTDVFAKATATQPPVPPASVLDATAGVNEFGTAPLDLSQSVVFPIINNAVSGISQPSWKELTQTLGNGTGDILSDSFVTESDGSVSLDINFRQYDFFKDGFDLSFLAENATFFLNRIRLTNMDKVDMGTISFLKPISKFVTDTYIKIPAVMKFQLDIALKLPQSLKNLPGPPVTTNISLALDLDNLEIALQLLTALDQRKFNGLSVGNFIQVDAAQTFSLNTNGITCLLRLFYAKGLSIPKLMIGLNGVGSPTLTASSYEFISKGTIMTLQAMIRIFADFYVPDLRDITQGGLRVLLNTYLLEPNLQRPGVCENPAPPPLSGTTRILNFKKSTTVSRINDLTSSVLAGKDGKYSLFNRVIGSALNTQVFFKSPDYEIGFDNLNVVYKKKVFGTIAGYLRDLSIKGIGTFNKLNLLNATTNTTISNALGLDGPTDFSFGLKWALKNIWLTDQSEDGQIDEIQLTLGMKNLTLGIILDLELDIPDFLVISAGSFNNFSQISCALTAFRSFTLKSFAFDVDKVSTELECAGLCESPLFKGIASGVPISSGDGNSFAAFIPQLISLIVNYLNSDAFDQKTQTTVSAADRSCASALNLTTVYAVFNAEPVHGTNIAVIFALALLGIGSACVALTPLAIPRHYQLKDKLLAENLLQANSMAGANAQSVARFMAKAERDQVALAWHPAVTACCKCFVPVMALTNVLLLALSFIVYLSFSVDARLYIFGSETKTYTLVPWTVSSTINDMWNSGAWPLSILIVFASCFWPVLKNLLLVAIWFMPKTFLSHGKRMYFLIQLDVLGKWSFLDVYIIVILVAALRFSLILADAPLLQVLPIPTSLLIIDVIVTPGIGIVMLCVAAFMSLIVNHVIIWELQKAQWADKRLYKQIDGEADDMLTPKAGIRLAISEYVFSTTTPSGQRDRYGPKAKNSVILLVGFACVWLIVGYFVPYVTLVYNGVTGVLLSFFIQGGRKRSYSLISIGTALLGGSTGTPYSNALFLFFAVLYFITVIVSPLLQMALHLFLWLRPLSLKDAHTVLFFAKVAAYWASLEVFCVGIVATTIEIKPVTLFLFDFITGGTCSVLKAPLTNISFLGERDGNCLTPAAYVEWGFFISLGANLFQIFVGAIMIRASGVAIRDREDVLERQPHQQWSLLEYLVLDRLLVYGAAHHKPIADPDRRVPLLERIGRALYENPTKACTDCGSFSCSKLNICSNCCVGVQDVSLTTPVGKSTGKVGNSKWNVPPSAAPSSKWNAPPSAGASSKWNTPQSYGAPASATPSWNMSPTPKSSQQIAVSNSMNLDSSNPVFAREQQKNRYSIDV